MRRWCWASVGVRAASGIGFAVNNRDATVRGLWAILRAGRGVTAASAAAFAGAVLCVGQSGHPVPPPMLTSRPLRQSLLGVDHGHLCLQLRFHHVLRPQHSTILLLLQYLHRYRQFLVQSIWIVQCLFNFQFVCVLSVPSSVHQLWRLDLLRQFLLVFRLF